MIRDDRHEILCGVDLPTLAAELGLGTSRPDKWTCPNPTHAQSGQTPPCSIEAHGPDGYGVWHCFGCGAGGSAVDMLVAARGLSVGEAFETLRRAASTPEFRAQPRHELAAITTPKSRKKKPTPLDIYADRVDAPGVVEAYVASRRWDPRMIHRYNLFAVKTSSGHIRVRHTYRYHHTPIWYQDRAVDPTDKGPKWLSPKGVPQAPYAYDLLLQPAAPGPCWVCEGPADLITKGHVGNPDTAAIGIPGTAGVLRWAEYWEDREIVICTDADAAGDACADEILTVRPDAKRMRPPEGHDLTSWRAMYDTWDDWADVAYGAIQ